MKVAVIGGDGVLGQQVLWSARAAGIETAPLSRSTAPRLDVSRASDAARVLDAIAPDAVLNLAAMTDVDACQGQPDLAAAVNIEGAAAVASWASHADRRLVHVSTDAVFDGSGGWYREDDAARPVNVYGATKLAGEMRVLDEHHSVVRCNFLAPGPKFLLRWLFDELTAGRTVTGYTDFRFSPLAGSELAGALLALLATDHRGLLHVGGADGVSKYDVACEVQSLVGTGVVEPGHPDPNAVPRPRDTTLDSTLARTVIDLEDGGWRASVAGAIDAMKEGA